MYEAEPTTTHASMASPWLSGSAFVSSLNAVHDRGYVIIENVMSPEDCRQYRDELEHHMAQSPRGRNVFEGTSSHRLYALLAKSERFAAMVEHPLALAFAEQGSGLFHAVTRHRIGLLRCEFPTLAAVGVRRVAQWF